MSIAELVASSAYQAIADDSLKDEDNGAWVLNLEPSVKQLWIQRFYWLRWVDRLAEQDKLIAQDGVQFQEFYQAWKRLKQGESLPHPCQFDVLRQIDTQWFRSGQHPTNGLAIQAWDQYLDAIHRYHQPNLTIATLRDYEIMLEQLAGSCFQLMPFLSQTHWQAAGSFGVVDQFYNNLRDLLEDALQGVCYFPSDLLAHFGVQREAVLDLSCVRHANYRRMMMFWLNDYLPNLRRKAAPLVLAHNLHPTWIQMRDWFLHRYQRIEWVMRECDFDFVRFPEHYWALVRQDLSCYTHPAATETYTPLRHNYQTLAVAQFLKLSPASVKSLRLSQGWLEATQGKVLIKQQTCVKG